MINNRQNGRRRGRGGGAPRPNGSGNAPDRGNRLDNRARGNAAQLHEKYKALARDAQMQGDRVNTEYYLQFADHYFRVLSENRARFEEQQQQRPRRDDYQSHGDYQGQGFDQSQGDDQDGYEDEGELNGVAEYRATERQECPARQERFDRQDRPNRQPRMERDERGDRAEFASVDQAAQDGDQPRPQRGRRNGADRADLARSADAPRPIEASPEQDEPVRAERPRRGRRAQAVPAVETVEADRLPPAFGDDAPLLSGVVADEPVVEKKVVRRRRPRTDAVSADA